MSRRVGAADEEVLGRAYDRRLMGRIWAYTRPYRNLLFLGSVLFPAVAVVELAQPYLVKVAIDDHILRGDWPGLSRVALLFLGTLLVQHTLRALQGYLLAWTGQRVVHDLRNALFAHVQRLSARFFDQTPVGRLMTRMLNDVEAVGDLFASGVVTILGDAVTLIGVVAVMLALDWRLAVVAFAAMPVLFVVAVYFRGRAREAYREVRNRIARVNTYLQETLLGMTVIQLFTQEATGAREFARLNEDHRRAVFHRMRYDAVLYAVVELVGSVALASILWWGGRQILADTLTFGVLVAFMEYIQRFFLPIRDLSAKYTVMQSAMVAAERIFGLLDTPPGIVSPSAGHRGSPGPAAGSPPLALEFRDVWFAYGTEPADAGAAGWALRGLSLRIPRGQRVAVAGATGAGKTTLARLLTRTYDVQRGAVLVEGVDVREWDLGALRRHVGLVLQDVVVFSGTVEENLTLGRHDIDRSRVEEAAQRAHADGFIRRLPEGYAEPVRERGTNLSFGQRQLLSVARALVYNPPVLVLDEATSSVDPETEHLVQDAVDQLLTGRTSVVIAHRLSTIRRADRVLVLQHGQLREDGPHDALLRAGGLYAMLHELSFGAAADARGGRAPIAVIG
ncbi:MAG TPA: ABC transporter ATP-binding protein [Methylomirabilota bacterium]|nr:ABC transporter ATP-binding protein [Methylomirabilota bacterium]